LGFEMTEDMVTKGRFAVLAGVSQARVSQYLTDGQISGEAIVGSGHRARIWVAVAMEQLRRNLDAGANGRARVASGGDDGTVEDAIKRARLEQLSLANEHARAVREANAGRYVLADDTRQRMGAIAGRMVGMFEGSLGEFATAIAGKFNVPARDALHVLRTTFRTAAKCRSSSGTICSPILIPNIQSMRTSPAAPVAA
jgi:hypothetical protein